MRQFQAEIHKTSLTIPGIGDKLLSLDYFHASQKDCPLILFVHGFKGFKDWGHFPLMASWISGMGYHCCTFNFSHNGTNPLHPIDFVDLQAFEQNTFSKELLETGLILDELYRNPDLSFDESAVCMLGHSRGGGIAILSAAKDERVRKLATWASVSDLSGFFSSFNIAVWKKQGRVFIPNSRTNVDMPLGYGLYEDFIENTSDLNLLNACSKLGNKLLIIHGDKDDSVSLQNAYKLHNANPDSLLKIVNNAGHTFGGRHPWEEDELPQETKTALQYTLDFFK